MSGGNVVVINMSSTNLLCTTKNMKTLLYILPFLAGMAMTTQAGINNQLRSAINSPLNASFISFIIGTIAIGAVLLFKRESFPSVKELQSVDMYKYAGGLLGAFFVNAIILSVKEVGAANMFALLVAGQLFLALAFDHFGVLGMAVNPITLKSIIGALLIVVGIYFIYNRCDGPIDALQ